MTIFPIGVDRFRIRSENCTAWHQRYLASSGDFIGSQPASQKSDMMRWQEKLFAFMTRNSLRATTFFNLPTEQVVELGHQVEI
ncbi:MAG: hypothetical protein PHF56_19255 [Desulfuromonadaceae bacterium]|nr:hypothetical protein [Desulfuromonadaceae bacterium]